MQPLAAPIGAKECSRERSPRTRANRSNQSRAAATLVAGYIPTLPSGAENCDGVC